MLTKKTLERIAVLSKVSIEAIEKALKDEKEVDLEIPDTLTVLTADELTQRDANNKIAGKKDGEIIGEEKGKDLATKAIKNKLGITDASKDPDVVAGLIMTKIDGDTALKDQVKLLQLDISKKDGEITTLQTKLQGASEDSLLLSFLPINRTKALETSEHLDIVKKNLEFTPDGVKFKGEVLRDPTTHAALPKKEAIDHFYKQRTGLLETQEGGPAGRGAGSSAGGGASKFKTLKEVRKDWQAANPGQNWGNEKAQDHVKAVLKENPELVMEDDGNA